MERSKNKLIVNLNVCLYIEIWHDIQERPIVYRNLKKIVCFIEN